MDRHNNSLFLAEGMGIPTEPRQCERAPIHKSIAGVAHQILENSFGVLELEPDIARMVKDAAAHARALFHTSENDLRSGSELLRYQLLSDGHLLGFSEPPLSRKYLFRYLNGRSSEHIWPNREFQKSSEKVADVLHTLLEECWNAIQKNHVEKSIDLTRSNNPTTSGRKRPRLRAPTWNCPLDYFFYHNRDTNHGKNKSMVVNCSPHTDRGLLVVVCLTSVPGLEILHSHRTMRNLGNEYLAICPGEIWADRLQQQTVSSIRNQEYSLACIMTGDQWQSSETFQAESSELPPEQQTLCGCVHQVRNSLSHQRLSVSYELRLPANKNL